MTLQNFLSALTTENQSVTIADSTGTLITFTSQGYASVESDILARDVESWGVTNKGISVTIAAIPKPDGYLTLSADSAALTSVGDTEDITVTSASGDVTAVSSDVTIAEVTVDKSGTDPIITIEEVAEGSATITVTAAETATHKAATATIAVTCTV